jgi:hypothetical protein
MMRTLNTALILTVLLLVGCEGLFTGTREASQPLTQGEDGTFTPVKLQLAPEMNPIAFNLHANTVANQVESQHWNTYRATLTLNGAPVASASFHVNNPGSGNSAQGGPFSLTMLYASVPQPGDYELTIALAKPKEITIDAPRLEVRRNTQPPLK